MGIEPDPSRNESLTNGREGIIGTDHSRLKALIIPTNEELLIVPETVQIISS